MSTPEENSRKMKEWCENGHKGYNKMIDARNETMVKQIFKVGDKVKYIPYGDRIFTLERSADSTKPLRIYTEEHLLSFYEDGRLFSGHKVPLLILIERPSQEITITEKQFDDVFKEAYTEMVAMNRNTHLHATWFKNEIKQRLFKQEN